MSPIIFKVKQVSCRRDAHIARRQSGRLPRSHGETVRWRHAHIYHAWLGAVALLVMVWVACAQAMISQAKQPMHCWADARVPSVLAIAEQGGARARESLLDMAEESGHSEAKLVSRTILSLWDDNSEVFRAQHAVAVDSLKPSASAIARVLPGRVVQTSLVIEVTIGQDGCVAHTRVIERGRYPRLLAMWRSILESSHFVPKNSSGHYERDRMVLTLSPEVR